MSTMSTTSQQQGGLARGRLSTADAVAISVSILTPGLAMLLNVSGVAATAGGSTPLAFLLGGIACLALAFVVVGFTRRMASAGYAYTYVSRSLGQSPGFLAGWLYAFAFICFVPMTMAAVAYLVCDLFHLHASLWFPVFCAGMVVVVMLSVVNVQATARVQIGIGVATVLAILLVDVVVTARGGAQGNTLQPLTFAHTTKGGFSGVFYGIILGVTSYIGFETAADFGEETANPRKAIPIAVIASVIFAIILYVWTTYSLTIGFGLDNQAAFIADPAALKTVANHYIGGWAGTLVELGGILAALAACVGCVTATTRTLYAMSREGVLPSFLTRTHPRYKTPVNASIVVALAAIAFAAIIGFGFNQAAFGQPITVYYFFATLATLAVIVVYIALCLGGIRYFKRTHAKWNPVLHVAVPLAGVALFASALYGSIYPVPTRPLNATPYLVIAWTLAGIGVVLVLRKRRPEAIARVGSILGEEAADEPEPAGPPASAPDVSHTHGASADAPQDA